MATDVILPSQGQSVETCLILEWKVQEGDSVEQGDVLCTIETDKATFEVEAPESGTLLKTLYAAGEDAPVLSRIAIIGDPNEAPTAAPDTESPEPVASSPAPRPERTGGSGALPQGDRPARRVSPRARKMMEVHGVDVAGLEGSGPHGRILARDVEKRLKDRPSQLSPAAAPAQSSAASQTEAPSESYQEVPVKGVRRLIAERMLQSVQSTAQYTLHRTAPAAALMAYRKKLKESPVALGLTNVSINDFVMFAAVRALRGFPDLNAHFLGDRVRRFDAVHLGFAVDTPRGLMVPVIRNASDLSLRALAEEAARLRAACVEENIKPDELNGGTFTVSNLGSLGIEVFTPVLNPPQVGILGVGGLGLKAVRRGDEIVHEDVLHLSLTANHQIVDGAPAARFLAHVASLLESFDLALAV